MSDQTQTANPDLKPDDEVMLTITGRVVGMSRTGRLLIEYVKANGFPDRITVDSDAAGISMNLLPQPDDDEKAARQAAHRQIADAALDADMRARALAEMPYRTAEDR